MQGAGRPANAVVIGSNLSCLLSSYLLGTMKVPALLLSYEEPRRNEEEFFFLNEPDLFAFERLFRNLSQAKENLRKLEPEDLRSIYLELQDFTPSIRKETVCKLSETSFKEILKKEISVLDNVSIMHPRIVHQPVVSEDKIRLKIEFQSSAFVLDTGLVLDARVSIESKKNLHSLFTDLYSRMEKILNPDSDRNRIIERTLPKIEFPIFNEAKNESFFQ